MNIKKTIKRLGIGALAVALLTSAFLVYALAGLGANPITYSAPPPFVERYASALRTKPITDDQAQHPKVAITSNTSTVKLTESFEQEEKLVRRVFFEDEPLEHFLSLFAHPQKAQRVRIASAFSKINTTYTHDEESGYPDKRRQFWKDAEKHLPHIQNALFEALITSAEENTPNLMPYTLAWIPSQNQETVELLAWAANHHPDWWVRRFSVYFVVEFGGNEALGEMLMKSARSDPEYKVRKQVLDIQLNRIKKLFFGSDDS